ncbi:hypothetical protein JB92DRAFT_3104978 [Gautieria morchelliformis]|nr:hypothetical protein JB92DRAFT_3104978 [Gautieria morchelliformis]
MVMSTVKSNKCWTSKEAAERKKVEYKQKVEEEHVQKPKPRKRSTKNTKNVRYPMPRRNGKLRPSKMLMSVQSSMKAWAMNAAFARQWASASKLKSGASKLQPKKWVNVTWEVWNEEQAKKPVTEEDGDVTEFLCDNFLTPFPTPLPVPIPSPPPLSEMIPLLGELPPVLFALPVPLQFPTSTLGTVSEIKRLAY